MSASNVARASQASEVCVRPTNDNQSCWQATLSIWVLTAVACLGRGAAFVLRPRSCSQMIVKSEICAGDSLHLPAPGMLRN